ncbi:alpha/beta hydrolase [Nocardia sp. NBC_00881]|uniref:alpha/beta fold hydrolase n=1 Tax=Nocardia sp. NBC_00881 TaxID=2975995 RepID=UPI00386A4D37|nr:alpha/beta hydrolase [Nocardia sp. NBC_00881]
MIKEFAHGHTVFVADPPGQGRTEIVERSGPFGTDAVVASIGHFLDAVGVERAAVVGHSWGGGFALRFARTHHDRVESNDADRASRCGCGGRVGIPAPETASRRRDHRSPHIHSVGATYAPKVLRRPRQRARRSDRRLRADDANTRRTSSPARRHAASRAISAMERYRT